MGCGASVSAQPLNRSGKGIGGGAGSFELSESDLHFRTLVYSKRRLSDATLEKIVTDPIVATAFKQFLHGEFGEQKLQFWFDADKYQRLPRSISLKTRQKEAEAIFNKYFNVDAASGYGVDLDQATRDQIVSDLGIKHGAGNEGCKVTATDAGKLNRVYVLAAFKVFQDIKFTYLPVFMTSSHFEGLRGNRGFFKDVEDATVKVQDFLKDMSLSYILANPVGQFYFQSYLSGKSGTHVALEIVNLFVEIDHFKSCEDMKLRQNRLQVIRKRYGKILDLKQLAAVEETLRQHPGQAERPGPSILNELEQEIIEHLTPFEAEFKGNQLFQQMTRVIATSSISDYSKVNDSIQTGTRRTIEAVEQFSVKRNLKAVNEEPFTFQALLMTSQGRCFFKRFAVQNFMEDSILFWIAVAKFKEEAAKASACESNVPYLLKIGEGIISEFLLPDSPMLINVSAQLRERTIDTHRASQDQVDKTAFDAAQKEVFKLMENNLWKKFQSTPRFFYLKERFRERSVIKETQGRVGQMQLGVSP
mmetsp:Transcript_10283/g.26098  ORF Transcript_10283/g.26098 Transcript_10283/m.26098 type:complete len:531 (+) Transcript_10283:174-1766(+)